MALVEARDHAVRVLGRGGDLREVRRRTLRSLVHDGLAEWVDRREGVVRLTEAGDARALALWEADREFWSRCDPPLPVPHPIPTPRLGVRGG